MTRCNKLGAETVVANLCNNLATTVRQVNPQAEVIVWALFGLLVGGR